MTKKHYIAIAEILKGKREADDMHEHFSVEEALADYFASDNPRFDRVRFLKACGIEQEAQECAVCDTPLVGKRCPLGC